MCGGEGKRLWPLSRRSLPKYYVPLADGESLFQKAVRRALRTSAVEDVLLVTTEVNKHSALKQARAVESSFPSSNLIIRPEGKETFATLACALGVMVDRGANPDDILICAPSDHVIEDVDQYEHTFRKAAEAAKSSVVVIGIQPTEPSDQFGYIEYDAEKQNGAAHVVKRFTEKPDRAKAKEFLDQGNYLWNGGFYIGSHRGYFDEMKKIMPKAAEIISRGSTGIAEQFEDLPDRSIDYELSEKLSQLQVVPATFAWDDYGDLESFIPARGVDQEHASFDGENVTVCADKKLVVSVGVSDTIIVDTRDALLVAHKDHAGGLSKIVNELKKREHAAADHHHTGYRPWGVYEVLEEEPGYVIKKITVDPGCSSSIQKHSKRSEHWVVVAGTATITLDDKEFTLETNESLHIPVNAKHRIKNETDKPLVLIEVQTGSYLEEDDVVREEDPYLKEKPIRM